MQQYPPNSVMTGFGYFFQGARLVWHPKLRRYLLVPLLVNIVLFVVLTGALIRYFGIFNADTISGMPSWLKPFADALYIIFGLLLLMVYGYGFNMITNIIAAPFYGKLAEQTEYVLTGSTPPPEPMGKMVRRVMGREMQKLFYFLSRGLLIFLLVIFVGTIPLVNILAPLIGLAWSVWSMSIQYVDYPADNNQYDFRSLRRRLWRSPMSTTGLGSIIMASSVVPFINIFAMPAAVAGGTIFWLNELREEN